MNILNAIRKYILAVRPAYKDYLGKKTEEITIADIVIGEDYAHVDEQEGGGVTYSYEIPNTPITYFQPGEKYNVIIDGDKKEYMAFVGSDAPLLASNNTMQEIADNPEGWACGFIEKGNLYFMIINKASFPYNGKRFTITQTTTEEKWDVKKLPEECVPDSITKTVKRNKQKIATLEGNVNDVGIHVDLAYSTANSAITAAATAQNTANAAKTAAANAQSTADTAKTNAAKAQTAAEAAQKAADGITPDWGENDTSNKAYIANRTHYEIAPVTYNRGGYTVYNSIIYVDTATESDMCKWTSPDLLELLDSFEGLSFSFLGTDYTIGENAYAVAANTSNDCFLLYTTIQGNYCTLGAICKAEHGSSISLTFSEQIEGKTIKFKNMTRGFYLYQTITSVRTPGIIKCLDEKYVPDTIQRVGEDIILNSSTSGSTKKFKITVDDSGAISATEVTS